jgi:hypothetical protein
VKVRNGSGQRTGEECVRWNRAQTLIGEFGVVCTVIVGVYEFIVLLLMDV